MSKIEELVYLFDSNKGSHNALSWAFLELVKSLVGDYSKGNYMLVTRRMGSRCNKPDNGLAWFKELNQELSKLSDAAQIKTSKEVAKLLYDSIFSAMKAQGLLDKGNNDVNSANLVLYAVCGRKNFGTPSDVHSQIAHDAIILALAKVQTALEPKAPKASKNKQTVVNE